jgi:hypothetical protein
MDAKHCPRLFVVFAATGQLEEQSRSTAKRKSKRREPPGPKRKT